MAPYRSGAEATVRLSCSNPPGVVYLSYAPLRSSTPVGEAARRSTATAASAAPKLCPPRKGTADDSGSSSAMTSRAVFHARCSCARSPSTSACDSAS